MMAGARLIFGRLVFPHRKQRRSIMYKFDLVSDELSTVPYTRVKQAIALRNLISENHTESILEIGFCQRKSCAYIAAMPELIRPHLG
jgi:hypothetical protein